MFPSPYVPQKCFPVPLLPKLTLPSSCVPQYPCFPYSPAVPMFPSPYVPQSLCSRVHLFPSPDRCSPVPMLPVPMFPQLIHQSLCSPLLFHRSFYSLYSPNMFSSAYVPQTCSPVPMFPQLVHQFLCSPCLFHRSVFHSLCSPNMVLSAHVPQSPYSSNYFTSSYVPQSYSTKMHRRIHCCINSIYSKYRHSMSGWAWCKHMLTLCPPSHL